MSLTNQPQPNPFPLAATLVTLAIVALEAALIINIGGAR
jgi:hypothetical protein